jgi:predicted ATPase
VVCLIRLSLALWTLGDLAGSARRRSESLGLAEELGHPFSLCYTLIWDAVLQSHRGDAALAQSQASAAMSLSRDHRMPHWRSMSTVIHGWATAELGDIEAGIEEMRKGIEDFKAIGTVFMRTFQLGLLAEQYGRLGDVERGLALIAEAVASVERTNVRWCEAELFRRKGDLQMKASHHSEAEAAYERAVEVARYQGARSLELRSATRLAALWLGQLRDRDAANLLEPVLRDFGSGAELPDVAVARTLLRQIGTVQRPAPN